MRRPLLLTALTAMCLFVLMGGTGLAAATLLLGDRSVESGLDSDAPGRAEAFAFTASASGGAQSISVYVDGGSSAYGLAVGVYADKSGHPAGLLASGSTSALVAGQWNDVTLDSAPTLSSGTTYWLAVLGTDGRLNFRDLDPGTGSCSENSSQSNLTILPAAWTSGTSFTTCSVSAYVNGAASPPTTLAPANTALPAISGTAQQGQTLMSTNGTWANNATDYSYAWQDCDASGNNCVNIDGATSSSYTLQASDVGAKIRSVVTASNRGGSASASSAATAAVTSPPPTASFTYSPTDPVTGQPVHFDGTASTCAATPCSYTWADDPPTGGTWPLGSGLGIDFTFRGAGTKYVTLTVADALDRRASVEQDVQVATGVPGAPGAPGNMAAPVVSGQPVEGQTLSTTNGSWSNSPAGYGYQWQRCDSSGRSCANISGATDSSYTLTINDVGGTVRAVVTATNGGGSTPANSATTATITAAPLVSAPVNTAAPVISGQPVNGQTLSTTNGSWSNSPSAYGYQWQRCDTSGASCANVSGATASTYTLAGSDVGHTLRSVVTASNAGGSISVTSAQTATIASSGGTSCTLHATTANFTTTFASAPGGSVICLAAGSYGTFTGGAKSSMVTVMPEPGASVSMALSWNNVTFVTVTGVTVANATITGNSHDVAVTYSTVSSGGQMVIFNDQMNASSNILADHDVFANQACGSGLQGRFDIQAAGPNNTNPLGVTISNSLLSGGTADGVRIDSGSGVQVLNNEFTQFNDVDPCHTDPIQLYGGSHVIVKGNWFHNMSNSASCSFAQWDGGDHNVFENNVIDGTAGCSDGAAFLADDSSTISHNVFYNTFLDLGHKSGQTGSGTLITDNIIMKGISNGDGGGTSTYTATYNLIPGGISGIGNIIGSPVYVGGSHPSTWAGFALTAGSPGIGAASDGTNTGIELPTGG